MSGIGEKGDLQGSFEASLVMRAQLGDLLGLAGVYGMEHWRWIDGRLVKLHEETFRNVITTVGANLALDTILAGSAFTATVVMGLKGTGTAVIADTQASHASWLEVGAANAPAYSGTRKTPAFSAASAKSKTTSAAVGFTFTSSGTVFGAFININGSSAIDNTTGTLFSAGDFSGSRAVVSTDVINVTYTLTV